MIKIKRAYEKTQRGDGFRILVDRLWPRGMSKEKEHLHLWLKDIAPTTELREAFGHEVEHWQEFVHAYVKELENKTDLLKQIKQLEKEHGTVTLVYGAKDTEHNNAVVLQKVLQS
ncbi:MAG: DUF488 family protein [Candidatus Babeliales bacterium]